MARIFNARGQDGAACMSRSKQTTSIVLTTFVFAACRSQALLQRRAPRIGPTRVRAAQPAPQNKTLRA
jgi:hypothetical protein